MQDNSNMINDLTVCIAFHNEGVEVLKTVKSIRDTQGDIKIILLDDCSTDDYEYENVARKYKCRYVRNQFNLGSGPSKQRCVDLCDTKYFMLLDAHMRFYERDWAKRVIEVLKENPDAIVASNSMPFTIKNGVYENEWCENRKPETIKTACSRVVFDSNIPFENKWTDDLIDPDIVSYDTESNVIPVACVLGACYSASKEWWNYIGGLHGIVRWGYEEQFISIKSWMAGGKCLLIRDWCVGHLYRKKSPHSIPSCLINLNELFLIWFFIEDQTEKDKYIKALKDRVGEKEYDKIRLQFEIHKRRYEEQKLKFDVIVKHKFSYFKELNNVREIHYSTNYTTAYPMNYN